MKHLNNLFAFGVIYTGLLGSFFCVSAVVLWVASHFIALDEFLHYTIYYCLFCSVVFLICFIGGVLTSKEN